VTKKIKELDVSIKEARAELEKWHTRLTNSTEADEWKKINHENKKHQETLQAAFAVVQKEFMLNNFNLLEQRVAEFGKIQLQSTRK
jgi:uncharacterized protein YhaN